MFKCWASQAAQLLVSNGQNYHMKRNRFLFSKLKCNKKAFQEVAYHPLVDREGIVCVSRGCPVGCVFREGVQRVCVCLGVCYNLQPAGTSENSERCDNIKSFRFCLYNGGL